jgi:hypothetical protein
MNILDAVAISLPCRSCGDNYRVPLKDVLLSHRMLHQGCPVSQETECPPLFQSRLFKRKDIEELQRAWSRLENRARSDGGELVLQVVRDLAEPHPAVPTQLDVEKVEQPRAVAPLAMVTGAQSLEDTRPTTKKREKKKIRKRALTRTVKAKNKKTA